MKHGDGKVPKKRGRTLKAETKQRAEFARRLVEKGFTWMEIYNQYDKTPEGKADKTASDDMMRLSYNRYYLRSKSAIR
jgi:hypothetical protein